MFQVRIKDQTINLDKPTRVLADEILEMKHVSYKQIKDYDTIVYMGPIKNNVIDFDKKICKPIRKNEFFHR